MLEISMFMLCDSIIINPQGPQLISPQAILRPSFIPGNFSFGLSAAITGIKTSIPHSFYFHIKNPKGKIIHQSPVQNIPVDANIASDDIPEKYQGIVMAIDVRNLPLEEEGEYQFSIIVDNSDTASHSFPIYKKELK